MKLLIITSIKEYQGNVASILHEAQIKVFSVSDTTGFKDDHDESLMDDWFGSGEESFESIFIFRFTTEDKAVQAVNMIRNYNEQHAKDFPIRAFVLPVEKSSYEV